MNQAKPSQAKLKFFGFSLSSSSNNILGLSQAQAKLELFNFIDEPSLNMHYSTKLGSFTALQIIIE